MKLMEENYVFSVIDSATVDNPAYTVVFITLCNLLYIGLN